MTTNRDNENKISEIGVGKTKLTEWRNEPSVMDLKQHFTDADTDRNNHVSRVDLWLDNLYVTGATKRKKVPGKSSITPKLIRKQAEWRYASLSEPFLETDDIFKVDPVTYEDKESAIQNQLVLNNQFSTKINKVNFIDEYVRTAVDEGTVMVRVGWDYQYEEVVVPVYELVETDDPTIANKLQEILQRLQADPNYQNTLDENQKRAIQAHQQTGKVFAIIDSGETTTERRTLVNKPTLEIVNYNNITIDPTAQGDINKANFVIYSFETSLSELKKDKDRYTNLDSININANDILGEPDHEAEDESNFNFKDKKKKKFVAYEYWGFWDIDGDGVLQPIVATYVGDVMIRMEKNPFPDKQLPFIVVQYLPVRKSMYGEPDGALLEDNQKIIGAVTRGMIDIMGRSANGQQGMRKDALDITNRRKFINGDDYQFNPGIDPRQAFHMHTFPEIPQSAQFMLAAQGAEAESLTGVRPFSQSSTGNLGANTAVGVRTARDASTKREMGILRRLAEGIKQIGRKFISMNSEFLDDEEIIRITNEEFVPVRRDDLAGKFDLKLSISTAESDASKAEELAFMLQTTGQTMGPEFSQIILADIARLRKMPDLAKRIEEYQPQPDPLAQEEAQLRIELLRAQIANEQAKANENNANAALDQAKAANLNSDTDQKNLNFMEQEAGVTQARNLQLQGEQARSNMELEDRKHLNKIRENLIGVNNRSNNTSQ